MKPSDLYSKLIEDGLLSFDAEQSKLLNKLDQLNFDLVKRSKAWFGQKKIIIYLNDVTNKNGPFQYIPGTSQLKYKLLRVAEGKSDRIADNEINANKIVTLTGKAGTSYLFDGTMVHRGKPPVGGERFAVTAYLYSGCYSEDKIRKYFNI